MDQFDQEKLYDLKRPTRLCTPVEVDDSVVKDADTSLMCYQVRQTPKVCASAAPKNAGDVCRQEKDCGGKWKKTHFCQAQPKFEKVKGLFVTTELLPEQVDAFKEDELCVPSMVATAP